MTADDFMRAQAATMAALQAASRFCLCCGRELPNGEIGVGIEGKRPGTFKGVCCNACFYAARPYVDAMRGT